MSEHITVTANADNIVKILVDYKHYQIYLDFDVIQLTNDIANGEINIKAKIQKYQGEEEARF